ncbi:MAG: hypothetical protein KDD36_01985 [Flavobacteriales bacterium]|nr:hypothetical protein [Flavobacteriales bacterium]
MGIKRSFLIVVVAMCTTPVLFAQVRMDGFAFSPKLGCFHMANHSDGVGLGGEFQVRERNNLFSLGYYEGYDIFMRYPSQGPTHSVWLMIGKYRGERLSRLYYQIGISPVWGRKNYLIGNSQDIITQNFFRMGLGMQVGYALLVSRSVGLGVDMHANLNTEGCMYMPMLSLKIGRLRRSLQRE